MDDGFPRRLVRLTRHVAGPERAARRMWRGVSDLLPLDRPQPHAGPAAARVVEITEFGANPGRLRMYVRLPPMPPRAGAPLLVLLHGCGQDAARFAESSGFGALADRLGAPLLLPDQQTENNHHRCFNWFRPGDTARGGGEAASVRQMVDEALRRFEGDPRRVFVAGLSAGGALAAALLAAYPDVFAAGGVVAGLPVGTARDVHEALLQMRCPEPASRESLLALVPRRAGVRWPRLSVWHGEADRTVDPGNADALVAQWTGLLGLPEAPDVDHRPAPHLRRRVWGEGVEQWSLAAYGHAFPSDGDQGDPFVLPAGICAAAAMAGFWGLVSG